MTDYIELPKGYDFSTRFPTWIIAFCPDTDSWFVTNQRCFYYEYPNEFLCEDDAVTYFKNHIGDFIKLNNEMHPRKVNSVFLENTNKWYT